MEGGSDSGAGARKKAGGSLRARAWLEPSAVGLYRGFSPIFPLTGLLSLNLRPIPEHAAGSWMFGRECTKYGTRSSCRRAESGSERTSWSRSSRRTRQMCRNQLHLRAQEGGLISMPETHGRQQECTNYGTMRSARAGGSGSVRTGWTCAGRRTPKTAAREAVRRARQPNSVHDEGSTRGARGGERRT